MPGKSSSSPIRHLSVVDAAFGKGADLYNHVLGVQPNASSNQIQGAFLVRRRDLLEELEHSSKVKRRKQLQLQVDAVVLAVRCLGEPAWRAEYDDLRSERLRQYKKKHGLKGGAQHSKQQQLAMSLTGTDTSYTSASAEHDGDDDGDVFADIPMKSERVHSSKKQPKKSSRSPQRSRRSSKTSPASSSSPTNTTEASTDMDTAAEQQHQSAALAHGSSKLLNGTVDTGVTGEAVLRGQRNNHQNHHGPNSSGKRKNNKRIVTPPQHGHHSNTSRRHSPPPLQEEVQPRPSPTTPNMRSSKYRSRSTAAAPLPPSSGRKQHRPRIVTPPPLPPPPPALDHTMDSQTWDDTLDRTLDTTLQDDATFATIGSDDQLTVATKANQTIIERIQDEILGAIDDTSRSLEQVFNVFTLQEEDITAVTGKIAKAKRQIKRAF